MSPVSDTDTTNECESNKNQTPDRFEHAVSELVAAELYQGTAPEVLANELRRQAGELSNEDYRH